MDVTHILDGLNDQQRAAVTAPLGNLLVVAGAGSGKTRVLVHRIAWLVEVERAAPGSVLAVTFTNKAAGEMRGRVERLLEGPARAMWLGTFHGIAHRLLRMHWRDADLPQNFQILDAEDQLRLVKRVMREQEVDEQKWPPRQSAWFINAQKDEGRRAKDVPRDDHDVFTGTQAKIYEAYEQLCRQGGLVDFAELLLRCHELLLERPDLLEHYQRRFRHLLVDEFQDTNRIQYAWLRVLAGAPRRAADGGDGTVWAVGDDDQAIYGWRGAKVENIRHFQRHFPAVGVVRLERNYRSTGTILRAANALIGRNTDRLGKNLFTEAGDGNAIRVYSGYNDLDEARFIADRAQSWIDAGGDPAEVAVLYRSNAQSRVVEEAFLRLDLPYRIYGGVRFYERAEVRNALAYMRLVETRHADVAFERVVNTPPRGIGGKTVEIIRGLARAGGVSMWQACREGIAESVFSSRAKAAVADFLRLVDDIADAAGEQGLREIASHCVEASGLAEFHGKEGGERGIARQENLRELVHACAQFGREITLPNDAGEDDGAASELGEFLDQAALESGDYQSAGPAVQMMTLHSAKGLEFPLVFICGMETGLFPDRRSQEDPGRLEEERRLAYVGITRAMRQLYLTYAETRRLYGAQTVNWPSPFLDEIPSDCVEEVRLGGSVARPFRTPRNQGGGGREEVGETTMRVGQTVRHPTFGEGVILHADGHGERTRVQVHFARGGAKWLILAQANLAPVG